jgi:hypothetical protein
MQWIGRVVATFPWRLTVGFVRCAGALLLLALAGCAVVGQNPGLLADARSGAVALDSVDGPPAQISQEFLLALNEAASARGIAIVPKESSAPYRLRGYLSLQGRGTATSIAWAWDIYDPGEHRAFRLTGEEPANAARKSWAAAEGRVLQRIAQSSIEQIAAFLASPPAPGSPQPDANIAQHDRTVVGRSDDFAPEASGIFRLFPHEPATAQVGREGAEKDNHLAVVPVPPRRPAPPASDPAALAYTNSDR